jgi:hypothetical protein
MPIDDTPTPKTLEEAEQTRQELTLDVQSIQAQLGDRQRTDDDGNRLSTAEYWQWKKKAQHALNQKLGELRGVKKWMREKNAGSAGFTLHEAIGHVQTLCDALEELGDYGIHIDAAKDFLSRTKPPPQTRTESMPPKSPAT